MASPWTKLASPRTSRAVNLAVWGFATLLVAVCIAIVAWQFGHDSTRPGLSDLRQVFPLAFTAASLVLVFLLAVGLNWHSRRESRQLQAENLELSRLALVASKTDNAAFITNPDGNIQWVNDGFVRLTGHSATEALGKQPGPLLLGQLQNIKVNQKLRDGISHRRIFTVEMLCSNRRGHRFWMSLNMTPVVDDQGHLNHYIGIGQDITARRKAEEEVAKVGRRSELLLNAAADGIFGFDLQGVISFVNSATTRMTGFESDDLIGQPLSSLLHQLRVNRGNALQDELFAGAAFIDGSVQVGESDEFRRKDGTSFPVEYSSTPVYEGNNLIGSVVVFRDITARAQAEALRTRQMRQSALRADVAFALTSGDSLRGFLGRAMLALVKHLDGAFARVWTLNAADLMLELQASSGIYSHINGPHGRIPVGTLKVGKIARDGAPQISENLLADPDILDKDWVARERMAAFIGFPLFLEGNLVGVMALFSRQRLPEDAMELLGQVADTIAQGIARKQAEESQGRQTALLDKVADAVLVVGLDDRLVACNEAACRLHGWDGNPPIGQQVLASLLADPNACSRARGFTLQEGSWRDEFSAVPHPDGPRPVDCRWFLATDESGAPESFIIVQTDTAARRELERRLLANQRTETVGLLARGLAHELTDTLFPILVSTETLQTRATDEATRESLALLEANARRSIGLVRQIQTLGAPANRGDARPTPTPEVAANLAAIIRGTFPKNLQTRAEIAPDLWTLRGDAVATLQALLNLALVAGRQMPDGGVFTLAAANVYLPEGDPSLPHHAEPGCHVRFTLSHTGAALPDDLVARLAEAGRDGNDSVAPGLGDAALAAGTELERAVASALHLLREQRAFLTIEPGSSPGTSLSVSVPAETPAEGVALEPAEPARPSGHGEVILVVDDEESLLTITKDALESFGYRALTARDGAEAVATYSAHRQDIRAVITDMVMPNMDGPSTIRVLRKLDPTVPIIASSGLMEPAKVRELTGESDLAFLEKPYSADLLLQTVHAAVQRAP